MLEARERSPGGMEGQLRTATVGECLGYFADVRSPRDALVGDRMQPRQRLSHENLAPASSRAPRSQSLADMRSFPAGCTSKISIVPPPVAIASESPAEITSPGARWDC